MCRSHLATRRPFLYNTAAGPWRSRIFVNTAIKLNIIRSTCYRLSVWSHVLLSGIQIACVLHLSLVKFQQEWSQGVHCGAVWRIRKKRPQTRCQKLPQRPLRQKRGSPNSRLASAYYIPNNTLPWKQCQKTTLSWIRQAAVGQVRRFCTKLFFAGNVVSCSCRGMHRQSNQFQMTWQKYITDASNLIEKAKFVVAVFGPLTHLSTDAAVVSRVPHQSPSSGNINGTLLQSQIYVTRWHHIHALQATCYFHQS